MIAMSGIAALLVVLGAQPTAASATAEPVALVRHESTVWFASVDSELLHTVTVDEHSVVAHPRPGLVVFVAADQIEQFDLQTGERATIPVSLEQAVGGRFVDGQRIGVMTTREVVGDGLEAAAPPPEVDRLAGFVDVVSGETVDAEEWFDDPVVARQTERALLVGSGAGTLHVVALDRPLGGPIELPTTEPDNVVVGPANERWIAALADEGTLYAGPIGDELTEVATDVSGLVGAVPGGVIADTAAGRSFIGLDGVTSPLPEGLGSAVVASEHGLLAVETDSATAWYRIAPTGEVQELAPVADMTFVAAGGDGWWFSSGDRPAPFDGSPLVVVDPSDGDALDVTGNLQSLAALAYEPASDPDARYLVAPFQELLGFTGLAVADAASGSVRNLDQLVQPLAFSPDGRYVLSSTVSGPTITTLEHPDGSTLINPIFDIDLPTEAAVEYRWLTTA
jgi:hypothetical protein